MVKFVAGLAIGLALATAYAGVDKQGIWQGDVAQMYVNIVGAKTPSGTVVPINVDDDGNVICSKNGQ